MATVGSNERISITLPVDVPPPRGESREWELGETALKVLKVIGVILVGASAICFIAGLEVPAAALLVIGAAALIFGFSCGTRATAALSNEVPTTNEAPTAARQTSLSDAIRAVPQAPARDEGTFEQSMLGAASGPLIADSWNENNGFTEISHVARSAARAIEQHRTTQPDQPLETLFENNLKASEWHAARVAHKFPRNGAGWNGKYIPEEELSYPRCLNLGALLGISTVGAIYYADINDVVEKSILFARIDGVGIMQVSAITALSVAVALILQGHNSIEAIADHTLNISKEVYRDELKYKARKDGFEEECESYRDVIEEADECLKACIKGGNISNDCCYSVDHTVLGLRAAFIGLRKAKGCKDTAHPDPFTIAIQRLGRIPGNSVANIAASGALVSAYLGEIFLRDRCKGLPQDCRTAIQEHTARVARLSGAFPEAVGPSDAEYQAAGRQFLHAHDSPCICEVD